MARPRTQEWLPIMTASHAFTQDPDLWPIRQSVPTTPTSLITSAMSEQQFALNSDYIALNQLLKLTGICPSGGSAKLAIAAGEVRVDGAVETRKTCKIRTGQTVRIGDDCIRVVTPGAPGRF